MHIRASNLTVKMVNTQQGLLIHCLHFMDARSQLREKATRWGHDLFENILMLSFEHELPICTLHRGSETNHQHWRRMTTFLL